MTQDFKSKLIEKLKLWEDQSNSFGFGLAIDHEGNLYTLHYAGMGNLHFECVTSENRYLEAIHALIENHELIQHEFEPAPELGDLDIAQLKLV